MLASAVARMPSQAIISHLRLTRSTITPEGSASSGRGTNFAKPTIPAFAGEPVRARTNSGYATVEACDPSSESACPPQSNMKSRFLRSG
jgi:hypothetical protein